MKLTTLISLLPAFLLASTAQAHITLQNRQAAVGSYYKAILQVPHGCQGADTNEIRVRIPDGVLAVKPRPKTGWTLKLTEGQYAHPQALHGAQVDHGVREIDWTGDLPDKYYDEFTFVAYLSTTLKPGEKLYFPVVQQCQQGVLRWIDTSGDKAAPNPAPHLLLTAPEP